MDQILFGHNQDQRIVAVSLADEATMRLYVREADGIRSLDERFYPFFFLSNPLLLTGFAHKHWMKQLEGTLFYQHLCVFEEWSILWEAVHHVLTAHNANASPKAESYADLDSIYLINDPVTQYLLQTGKTLFKGMVPEDIHRMQIDIETYTEPPRRFSDARRSGDRIIIIALSDNRGWRHIIDGRRHSEAEMLREFVTLVRARDPDVLEGHNILGFDLPYIVTRCAAQHVQCTIGREGSSPAVVGKRGIAEDTSGPGTFEVHGRHIIDTLPLVQAYDAVKRNMESYGLKYAAQYFGIAAPDRVYIEGGSIAATWHQNPAALLTYAGQDVAETRALADLLTPTPFYLTQMVPCSYGTTSRMGAAMKIEYLLVREYLRRRHSLPHRREGAQTSGGYTDVFLTGILGPVLHIDVESLYPSIMITQHIAPAVDTLDVFPVILGELTRRRLEAKRAMKALPDGGNRAQLDAIQSSLKILINSFYGYMGYGRALFNDFRQADVVTQTGQRLLRQLIRSIVDIHGQVIEVDTDGIFFVPPSDVTDENQERDLVTQLGTSLPEGITLAMDGRYAKMLSYKKKNYALLEYDGRVLMKGSSLISRSMERFGRAYVRRAIELMLNNDIMGLHTLYLNISATIRSHGMAALDFARVETLRESVEEYEEEVRAGKRNKSAAYEVALEGTRTGQRWRPGDRVAYYITGTDANVKSSENCKAIEQWDPNFPDENVLFYLRRLDEFSEKFLVFFRPSDFRRIFGADELFPLDPAEVHILTLPVQGEDLDLPEDSTPPAAGIWLDE